MAPSRSTWASFFAILRQPSGSPSRSRAQPASVAIAGIAETAYYKRGAADRSEFQLTVEAILAAAEDAGLDTYVLLWWVSRLVDGENIALILADDEWSDRCAGIRVGDLETEWITLHDGSDPEADPAGEAPGQPD